VLESRLGLGTVQFGIPYGVANLSGHAVSREAAAAILARAAAAGIDTLDTAIAYGESEATLGEIGAHGWRVITKLPAVPDGCADVAGWVQVSVAGSLRRLRLDRVYGLLLHHPRQLLGRHGAALAQALISVRESGQVEKIGVSIYSPEELESFVRLLRPDLVQAPFNVVDRRLATSGWLARLQDLGTEVHARSIFLQGLLLMERGRRPRYFERWNELWDVWHQWLQAGSLSPLQACMAFAGSETGIHRLIVGVDSLRQFEEILDSAGSEIPPPPLQLASEDVELVDPSRWLLQ
jgi:aryl-alcohol dehydrogenase-like predicted oxidoreductase